MSDRATELHGSYPGRYLRTRLGAKRCHVETVRRVCETGLMVDRRADEAELVAEFWEAMRAFLRRSELVARKHGLTPQRQQLLVMIAGSTNGSSTITALSARLSLAQNTVTELVRRAETAGLIKRQPSRDDARVTHLTLTREGNRRMRATMADLHADREVLEAVLGALREREA